MSSSVVANGSILSVRAYRGDARTLLALNIPKKTDARGLAGFTISYMANGNGPFYLHNSLRFEHAGQHAQDNSQPANSTLNAPLHKFRWIHFPGSVHQGIDPYMGAYRYTVTPRYFDAHRHLLALDASLSVSVEIEVAPFVTERLAVGFTRGFTQSQAFVNHFGPKAQIRPKGKNLLWDTTAISGTNAAGETFSFGQEYDWLGFTARQHVFRILDDAIGDKTASLDVFAYDLNEPDLAARLLQLAKLGRVRVILDNAALHHSNSKPKPEDDFEAAFRAAAKSTKAVARNGRSKQPAGILRGKFGRYSHDKIFVAYKKDAAVEVLTGSTNFSVTGLYVNSNHVLVYSEPNVAAKYAELFQTVWECGASRAKYVAGPLSSDTFASSVRTVPKTEITFAPHDAVFANKVLDDVAARIAKEGKKARSTGSVLFAVMQVDHGVSAVWKALKALHENQKVFSYGISDTTDGIELYKPGRKTGVLVTGKPVKTQLPEPFNQVPGVGIGHQIHHKFLVCGFNSRDPVVYCGSSNLAVGGETENGDNLLAIHDEGVATVFAIEALGLVDHFHFLDRLPSAKRGKSAPASKELAAARDKWFLSTTDRWTAPYYDSGDLHCVDRLMFA